MIAFIIFGTRGVRSTIQEGQFYCPQCNGQSRYKHKKVTQFFTLYFIPLIPLGNKGQYVECQRCKNTYIERILQMQPTIDITEQEIDEPVRELPDKQREIPSSSSNSTNDTPSKIDILSEKQKVIKKLLIMMILADGKVEDSEIHMFHKVYRKMANATVNDIYKEIEEVRRENKRPYQYLKQVAAYLNEEGKRDIIKSSMMIAAADGDIDPTEISMVENFGKALEMKPAEVRVIIQSAK